MCFNLHQIREYTHIYRVFHDRTDQTLFAIVEVGKGLKLYHLFLVYLPRNIVEKILPLHYIYIYIYIYI